MQNKNLRLCTQPFPFTGMMMPYKSANSFLLSSFFFSRFCRRVVYFCSWSLNHCGEHNYRQQQHLFNLSFGYPNLKMKALSLEIQSLPEI